MKKLVMIIASFIAFAFIATLGAQVVQQYTGIPEGVTVGLLSLGMVVKAMQHKSIRHNANMVMMAVQVEIWSNFIAENIYKNNEFLKYAFDADEFVLAGKVVHIPQSGTASNVVKNRSSLPATVTKRTDTDVTYALDEYTTDPRVIPNADTVELSYDKMASVMEDDMNALQQTCADNMVINWAPASATSIIRTTGGKTGVTCAPYLPAQTGNRYAADQLDVLNVMTYFNSTDVVQNDRYGLMSAQMYSQVIQSLSATQYTDFSKAYDQEKGILGKLHTFNILMRSTVLIYTNAATPVVKAYGAAGAATDNDTSLFWQKNGVERALGEIKAFNRDNDPQYYGDLMSFLMRMGGRIRRADEKGVAVLVQAAAA